jgi:hypothetical protein
MTSRILGENICKQHAQLVSWIYKKLPKLNNKNNLKLENVQKKSTEDIKITNKHIKCASFYSCSISLAKLKPQWNITIHLSEVLK